MIIYPVPFAMNNRLLLKNNITGVSSIYDVNIFYSKLLKS